MKIMAIISAEDRSIQDSGQSMASQDAEVEPLVITQSEVPLRGAGSDGVNAESTNNTTQ